MVSASAGGDIARVYCGHNGWISLDASQHLNEDEVRGLALFSYRHFALKRMLKRLA